MLRQWDSRTNEEARLFNPSFCATLLAEAAADHQRRNRQPLPFPLAFLVLPVVLHRTTREALPSTTVTALLPWIERNRETLAGFPTRVASMRDVTREAIVFGLRHGVLDITEPADLTVGPHRKTATPRRTPLFTDEVRACLDRAAFVGRWFAAAGTTATIYASLGVSP